MGDMSPPLPPAYIKSLTPHLESLQCIHVGYQEGLYVRAEQTLSVLGADTERTAIPYLL